MPQDKSFENCKFYRSLYPASGECRFNPPAVTFNSKGDRQGAVFPEVERKQWCGRFQPEER